MGIVKLEKFEHKEETDEDMNDKVVLTSDDSEIDKALEGMFDSNTEVVSFEVDKDLCSLERKGKIVGEIPKKIEEKIDEDLEDLSKQKIAGSSATYVKESNL